MIVPLIHSGGFFHYVSTKSIKEKNMKRKMTFSLMLTLSLLLSLVSFPATAQAAPPRFKFDSGVVPPAMGQVLRITFNGTGGDDTIRVRIRWMQYMAQGCSGMPPVCRHMVVSEGTTPVETLGPGDALSFDVQGTGAGVRVIVESSSPKVRVLGVVFDTSTQRIVTQVIMANTEGD
jgi:hypothetical protein